MLEPDEMDVSVVEEVTESVTEDGDIVMEDVVAAIDDETGDAVVDDLVAVESPDGSIATEEVVTVISGEDGSAQVLADTVTAMDSEGNVEIAEVIDEDTLADTAERD